MQENYIQRYNNDEKKPIKVICLGICILLDLIVLAGVIACFSTKNYIDLLIYAIIFAVAMIVRILSLFLTYEIIIHYNAGRVSIIKKYPIKEIVLFDGQASQLKVEEYCAKANEDTKYVRLCPKSCENCLYVIELFERKYLICLDNYLFSLIEVNRDLS
ncbi:MAG: hypothetical protein K2L70_04610 [Clostridia bacterium]|nr:hypothetical protein [Clostridia bacterium]